MALGGSLVSFPRMRHIYRTYILSGIKYRDTVTIASGLVISGQSVGVALGSKGFDGVDGILG